MIVTYRVKILLRKGNQFSNWFRLVRPCTTKTGIRNKIERVIHATRTVSLDIHLWMNDEEKKGQLTSSGSGASSVIHSMGLVDCCKWIAIAAPHRDLKDTNAALDSFCIRKKNTDKQNYTLKLEMEKKKKGMLNHTFHQDLY